MRYSYLGSEIILVDHDLRDLIAGDLLVRLTEEADDDVVYKGKFFVVIDVKKTDIGIGREDWIMVYLGSVDVHGNFEFEERLDGYPNENLDSLGFRRVCNGKSR
jgi:hypothetical protein